MLSILQTIRELWATLRTMPESSNLSNPAHYPTGKTSEKFSRTVTQEGLNLFQHCIRHKKPAITRSVCLRGDTQCEMTPVSVIGHVTKANELRWCDSKVHSWDDLYSLMRTDFVAASSSRNCMEDDIAGKVDFEGKGDSDESELVETVNVECRTFPTWIVLCTVASTQRLVESRNERSATPTPAAALVSVSTQTSNTLAAATNKENGQANYRQKRAPPIMSTEEQFDYQVSPSWYLSVDKKWQNTIKGKCRRRSSKEISELPSPRVSSGGPFYIMIGDFYLSTCINAKGNGIITTDDITIATRFYIQISRDRFTSSEDYCEDGIAPLRDLKSGFYIYCRSRHGQLLYLTADSRYDNVLLVTNVATPVARGRFYLKHPGSRKLASLCQWPRHALHLVRKTAYTRRYQYLVMNGKTSRICAVFMSDDFGDDTSVVCQFRIQRPQTVTHIQRNVHQKI